MNLETRIINADNYSIGRSKSIQYIVIHYTANDGDTAIGNANYFSSPNRNASAHYFVDETRIVQAVKDTDTAWHCGTSGKYYHLTCRNNNSLGVELCSRKQQGTNSYYFKEETISNAVELVRFLMEKYNISIENIVRHYDVTHKICPEPFVSTPANWEKFKERLIGEEENMEKRFQTVAELPEWAKPQIQKLIKEGKISDGNNLNLSMDMVRTLVILTR